MANAKSAPRATLAQREQVAEAVMRGYLDGALASDLSTAKTAGFAAGQIVDHVVSEAPIGGVNR